MYRVAARFRDPEAQAVAARYASFGHSNLEEYWTLLWRDPGLRAAPMRALPVSHHFEDAGVIVSRTSWDTNATVVAFKAGPPQGHRVAALLPKVPEWRLDSGHAHPDAGSFIIWAQGRYLTGDTGYAGLPSARNHNTLTFGGTGQGVDTQHDVWRLMDYGALDAIRIRQADLSGGRARLVADLRGGLSRVGGREELHADVRMGRRVRLQCCRCHHTGRSEDGGMVSPVRYALRGNRHPVSECAARQAGPARVDRVAERRDGHDGARQPCRLRGLRD